MDHLIKRVEDKIKEFRRLKYILGNEYNQAIYNTAPADERVAFDYYVRNSQFASIYSWLNKRKDIDELPYRRLREMAQELLIPNYSRRSREELILLIKEYRNEEE